MLQKLAGRYKLNSVVQYAGSGDVSKGSLAAKAQSVADTNEAVLSGELPLERMQALAVDAEAAKTMQAAEEKAGTLLVLLLFCTRHICRNFSPVRGSSCSQVMSSTEKTVAHPVA